MKIGDLVRIHSDEDLVSKECFAVGVGYATEMGLQLGKLGRITFSGIGMGSLHHAAVNIAKNDHQYKWPFSTLSKESHPFSKGERVEIASDLSYLQKVCVTPINRFAGQEATVYAVSAAITIHVAMAAGMFTTFSVSEECLIPLENHNLSMSGTEKDLDELLARLYDAHKAHADCTQLLVSYRDMTGKQWPEFMR